MKPESLNTLFIRNILTLGLYEIVWLSRTRAYMIKTYSVKIPSIGWPVLVYVFKSFALLFLLYFLFISVPSYNNKIAQLERPDAKCLFDYVDNIDHGTPVSSACVKSTEAYYDINGQREKPFMRQLHIAMGAVVFALLSSLVLARWFNSFTAALVIATRNKLSHNGAMALFMLGPVGMGMLVVQSIFNQQQEPAKP